VTKIRWTSKWNTGIRINHKTIFDEIRCVHYCIFHPLLNIWSDIIDWIAATATSIVNEEASFADEVVVVIGDSEIVNRLLFLYRRYRRDAAPLPIEGLQQVSYLQLPLTWGEVRSYPLCGASCIYILPVISSR
jgi:hypothetical protein